MLCFCLKILDTQQRSHTPEVFRLDFPLQRWKESSALVNIVFIHTKMVLPSTETKDWKKEVKSLNYEKMKQLREAKGYTQKELAEKVYVTQSMIGRVEIGAVEPSLSLLGRIAESLGVETAELL